jgi:hypothetical protein
MKRLLWGVAAVGLVTGLSGCSSRESMDRPEGIAAEESEPSSPDISPSAAPGVAFAYGYNFKLADERISELQETHAAACEKLGLAQCRITGLRYTVGEDEQVSAMLQVKLEPSIARQFGKGAVADVERVGGRLVNAEFSGEDEGSAIRTVSTRKADIEARIADIERRLSGLGPEDRERTELQQQLEQLRTELAAARQQISASTERLANTPMTFNYYGKGGVPGFGGENPFAEAWRLTVASAVTLISVGLKAIGVMLPWALLIFLLVLLYRSRAGRAVRRWWVGMAAKGSDEA